MEIFRQTAEMFPKEKDWNRRTPAVNCSEISKNIQHDCFDQKKMNKMKKKIITQKINKKK